MAPARGDFPKLHASLLRLGSAAFEAGKRPALEADKCPTEMTGVRALDDSCPVRPFPSAGLPDRTCRKSYAITGTYSGGR